MKTRFATYDRMYFACAVFSRIALTTLWFRAIIQAVAILSYERNEKVHANRRVPFRFLLCWVGGVAANCGERIARGTGANHPEGKFAAENAYGVRSLSLWFDAQKRASSFGGAKIRKSETFTNR